MAKRFTCDGRRGRTPENGANERASTWRQAARWLGALLTCVLVMLTVGANPANSCQDVGPDQACKRCAVLGQDRNECGLCVTIALPVPLGGTCSTTPCTANSECEVGGCDPHSLTCVPSFPGDRCDPENYVCPIGFWCQPNSCSPEGPNPIKTTGFCVEGIHQDGPCDGDWPGSTVVSGTATTCAPCDPGSVCVGLTDTSTTGTCHHRCEDDGDCQCTSRLTTQCVTQNDRQLCFECSSAGGLCDALHACCDGSSCGDGTCCFKLTHSCTTDAECCSGACEGGVCGCAGGMTNCDGTCLDLNGNDSNNCGICGFSCPSGTSCCVGACGVQDENNQCGAACQDCGLCCPVSDFDNCCYEKGHPGAGSSNCGRLPGGLFGCVPCTTINGEPAQKCGG
jgi:hypothetical protein